MGKAHQNAVKLAQDYRPSPRFFEVGTALRRVWDEAPYLPRCSDDKTAALVRPREYALRYPYMQINRPGFVSWLIFDLDHQDATIWEGAGLPAPNLIVQNRKSGTSHLYYAIPPVCTSEKARSRPIAYMKAVYSAFALRLDADLNFHSGPVAKTPGHPWWLTRELHGHVYELGALADYVDLETLSPWARGPNLDAVFHSRHCTLFEELRYYAYSIVAKERDGGSFERFSRLLNAYAVNKNNFASRGHAADLPLSSLRSTVKSVARWTWDRYTGSGSCHRGVMRLDKSLPLVERQRLAAAHAHRARQHASATKVRAACEFLRQVGQELTLTAIAKQSGLTRQTVANYKHVIAEVCPPPSSVSIAPPNHASVSTKHPFVKFAVHQVTAAQSFGKEFPRSRGVGEEQLDFYDG